MTITEMPRTEADVLVLASGMSPEDVLGRLHRLSELERSVLEWRAPVTGGSISDREIARRLGMRRRQVRRLAEIAIGKLHHPAFGEAAPSTESRSAA